MGLLNFLSGGCRGNGATVQAAEGETFVTDHGKQVNLELYYHASFCIEYDGYRIQVDPVANQDHNYDKQDITSLVLVTHEHQDHFSPATIDKLRGKGVLEVVANPRVAEQVPGAVTMKNGDTLQWASGIVIEAVPAYNTTPGRDKFHPRGRDNGYILTLDGLRIYIAGDTEDIPEMEQLSDIDIAFLPCNQPYTMTPDQLVKAARLIKPRVLYPYHYNETDMSGVGAQLPGIDVRLRNMK